MESALSNLKVKNPDSSEEKYVGGYLDLYFFYRVLRANKFDQIDQSSITKI